ncbi:MAG: ABC transporter ATP-binding protein/permease [Clostridiales bacterium]|nr:ABC transporter ATP-binding protein/permease [Clostridiales bacterium]
MSKKIGFKQHLRIFARAFRVLREVCPPCFLSLTVISSTIDAAKPLIALFFSAQVLNELAGARDVQRILLYVAATLLSVFLLSAINALLQQRLKARGDYNYNRLEFLYAKRYMEMDYPHVEDSVINQMLADIRARANGNGLGLYNLIYYLPMLSTIIATLLLSFVLLGGLFIPAAGYVQNWVTSPAATLVLVLLAILSVLTPFFLRKWQREAMELVQRENPKANTLLNFYGQYIDADKAAKDIRLYNQAGALEEIFEKRLNRKMWIWFFRRGASLDSILGAVNALVGGAVYLFIGLRALFGMYALGSVVQYVGAVTFIITNMASIAAIMGQLLNNNIYAQNIFDFLDLSDPRADGDKQPDADNIEIEFDNVSFKYPGADSYALKNVSLRFTPGQRLAVVGMNGSGKTTMVKLLCRLYRPCEGVIRLNGEDIQNYDHTAYTRLFNVVFQDFKLFSLPLGCNVATAESYDAEKVRAALINAGFGEKLDTLEDGLNTMLGKDCDKKGTSLSGGEEQKVAIARAMYRDAPFVVFDEPTAALDPISEYEVYTKLNDIIGEKTAVFISHRLSSCRFCDDIAVFHEGELIQRGKHEVLLRDTDGKYCEMWNAQAQHYTDV